MSDKKTSFSLKPDPLVLLGFAVVITGIIFLVYGFIPQVQPHYYLVATGSVSINDTYTPETYFQSHYNGSDPMNLVQCYPSITGWNCAGYQQIGTIIVYGVSSRYLGLALMFLGIGAVFAGNRLAPFKPKPSHIRPITVRIDDDICVSNSVCVSLAPNVFQLKKQETPTIFAPTAYVVDPSAADNDTIIQAAEMCPTGAIIIEDAETGERIHPPLPKG